MAEVEVKTYRSEKAYKKDAKKMAENGWSVVSVNVQKAGMMARSFGGPWAARPKVMVTYQKP